MTGRTASYVPTLQSCTANLGMDCRTLTQQENTMEIVRHVVCVLVSGVVRSIGSGSIRLSGHKLITISRDWANDHARSQLYNLKKGDEVTLAVVEEDDCLFAVEVHSKTPAARTRRARGPLRSRANPPQRSGKLLNAFPLRE